MEVSELLESGKTMFKELSNEFEERLFMYDTTVIYEFRNLKMEENFKFFILFFWVFVCFRIHKEQMEKWQEEVKELRLVDASNEEARAM